jgi:exosortase/archaeosortase family protein
VKTILKQNREVLLFLLKLLIIYLFWKVLSWFAGEERIPLEERIWPAFSVAWEQLNDWVRIMLLHVSAFTLKIVGYDALVRDHYVVYIQGYRGVAVGNYCLGLQLWLVFAALVLSYPRTRWLFKLLFAIAGILIINLLNVFRFVGLNIMTIHAPDHLEFNHDYVFNILVYIFTFVSYVVFVKNGFG